MADILKLGHQNDQKFINLQSQEVAGYKFSYNPLSSFFVGNHVLLFKVLADEILRAKFENLVVLDGMAGVGSFVVPFFDKLGRSALSSIRLIANDNNEYAIEDLRTNLKINDLKNESSESPELFVEDTFTLSTKLISSLKSKNKTTIKPRCTKIRSYQTLKKNQVIIFSGH